MRIEFSFDDGHKLDFKVAAMLEFYGLRGMFYIPWAVRGHNGEGGLTDEQVRSLSERHDIGFHTFSHPRDIKLCPNWEVDFEVVTGRFELATLIGRPVTSFCYPRGKYDSRTLHVVRAVGYEEARTVDVGCTEIGFDPLRKPTTVHVYPGRPQYDGVSWDQYARTKLQEAKALGERGYFHLWGHSWEIEKFGLWDELEKVLAFVRSEICAS